MVDIATLSSSAFAPLVGQTVTLVRGQDGADLDAEVLLVRENPRGAPADAERIPFSVVFTSPLPCAFDSDFYSVRHQDLGAAGVERVYIARIVPRATKRAEFELVFN
jgi:hypothetical protein